MLATCDMGGLRNTQATPGVLLTFSNSRFEATLGALLTFKNSRFEATFGALFTFSNSRFVGAYYLQQFTTAMKLEKENLRAPLTSYLQQLTTC